jgi:hypothetical protein
MLLRLHPAAESSRAQLRLLARKVVCPFVDSPFSSGRALLPALRTDLQGVLSLAVPVINVVDRILPVRPAWAFRVVKV